MFEALDHGVGLSPLARGTPPSPHLEWRHKRFIPAGAGNTPSYCQIYVDNAVYPRWRGEHGHELPAAHRATGLSPLARGTLLRV